MHLLGYIKSTFLVRNLQDEDFKSNFQINYVYFLQYAFLAHVSIMHVHLGKVTVNLLCIYLLIKLSYLILFGYIF